MRLGPVVKHPDASRGIDIDWTTYIGSSGDTISGTPAWTAPTGLTIVGTPTHDADTDISTAIVSGGEEGEDYALDCTATFASGAVEIATVIIQVRSGDADPRLTR